jgi:regulator of replication initiation timing
MECTFCKKVLSTKSALNLHQKTTRYCLKIQGINNIKGGFICDLCGKDFQNKSHLNNHLNICEKNSPNVKKIIDENIELKNTIKLLTKENELLRVDKKDLQERYDNLATTAVKRPTTSTKNIQINNYIKNMPPLLESDINDNIQYLTLDHHVKGVEGYAEYALEFPFKDKIVCVDTARNKIKYKNEEGDVIDDVGFRKMMEKLCKALKDRSFNLSQEHYEKLSDTFTEKEVDDYNFMETAIAISKCANGKENDFCSKIVKMISKGVIVN